MLRIFQLNGKDYSVVFVGDAQQEQISVCALFVLQHVVAALHRKLESSPHLCQPIQHRI